MKKRCVIITSYIESTIRANISIRPDDYVICADGGFFLAINEGIIPNTVIGDFDSCSYEDTMNIIDSDDIYAQIEIIKTIPEKDDPDTMMCVRHAMEKGFDHLFIVGGLGGRVDHTMANIQTLSHILDHGGHGWILDDPNRATMLLGPDEITLRKIDSDYFSAYSFTEKCLGVYEIDAKFPLDDATLTQSFPLGTSNEFLGDQSVVKVRQGKLLVITSKK